MRSGKESRKVPPVILRTWRLRPFCDDWILLTHTLNRDEHAKWVGVLFDLCSFTPRSALVRVISWPKLVIPARYYLYSFQDIPAGPSIFQSIFQHITSPFHRTYLSRDSLLGSRECGIAKASLKRTPGRPPAQPYHTHGPTGEPTSASK